MAAVATSLENTVPEGDEIFPDSQRVIFEKAPLIRVVSQVLFPTILKIDQTPADFQERIRGAFPLYERGPDVNVPQGGAFQLPPQILQLLRTQGGGMPHNFTTATRDATITLTSESLSLTATVYTRWEHFLALFRSPLTALIEMYVPPFFTRVGLRYVNAINRGKVGLAPDRPWSQLIRQEVLGELAIPAVEKNLEFATNQTRLKIPNNEGTVMFQHGVSLLLPDKVRVYTLDFDFSKEGQIGIADAEPTFIRYHKLAGRAFRWCIRPELHDELGPKTDDDDGS